MRTVAIVASHFPPSRLAGVHRARLLSQHLAEFGWRPIVVTAHWRHYEEAHDWDLASLVDPALEVVRTPALPTKPLRVVGDLGVRALPFHLAALRRLRRAKKLDFLLVTAPSFYSALLGGLLWREAPLPFGIDYIDPWINVWPGVEKPFTRAWASYRLSHRLEPWAVRRARLISGVAPGYVEGVLARNPHLKREAAVATAPYGFSESDFQAAALARPLSQFDPADGRLHFVYAGALLPQAVAPLRSLFAGLAVLRARDVALANRLRLHFIGTGTSPEDEDGHQVQPFAEAAGVGDLVTERPHRMGYLDALAHLARAHAALVVGSTEAHYSPSKIFQCVQSRRPTLALLHEASPAAEVLGRSGAGVALTFRPERPPAPDEVADALARVAAWDYDAGAVDWRGFEVYSARASVRALAGAMDEAMERHARG